MLCTSREVKQPDTRNRKDNKCFYCKIAVGKEHKSDCPIPQKTVVVDMTIRCTIAVADYETPEDIDYFYNEYTAATNIYNKLAYYLQRHDDIYWSKSIPLPNGTALHSLKGYDRSRVRVEYVREATAEDEAYDGVYADDDDD